MTPVPPLREDTATRTPPAHEGSAPDTGLGDWRAPARRGGSLPDTADLRRRIGQADAELARQFWAGGDVEDLVAERARYIDAFLAEVWQHWFQNNDGLALLAVGGYGRGELHPHSDIDLLILPGGRRPCARRSPRSWRSCGTCGSTSGTACARSRTASARRSTT